MYVCVCLHEWIRMCTGPDYPLGITSTKPMAYEEILAYKAENVANDFKWRTFF